MATKGISQEEANRQLAQYGHNELHGSETKNFLRIVMDVIKEPMFLLLLSCTVLYLILGEPREGIMIASSIILILLISFYQNKRTEKALNALRELAAPIALVIRDGRTKKIPGREIVPDDIIIVNEGDRVPADATLLISRNLDVDESLLTGESLPVSKYDADIENGIGNKNRQMVYSGTLVVRGKATAKVIATGKNTRLGQIGESIKGIKEEKTRLQKEADVFIKRISIISVIICILMTALYTMIRGNILSGILSGIALSIALIPEEFPVIYTIFMAMGAWRIAKKNVVARTPSSIEALGTITTLCVDKTGTITQNKMVVNSLSLGDDILQIKPGPERAIPEKYKKIIEVGILASHSDPFDPMEKAMVELGYCIQQTSATGKMIREYPLSPALLAMSRAYSSEGKYLVAAKGAPETILSLCHIETADSMRVLQAVHSMAANGMRVIAVAQCVHHSHLPDDQHGFDFQFCGLIGLADPIRKEIPDAIRQCYTAGIRVIMMTGDYPATALSIAKQIGLTNCTEVLTGEEIANMSGEILTKRVMEVNVFARIAPEQKLLLVNTLKRSGEIVAMTGDGVNDAPALKSAHIGIAMGGRGTEVARASSSLILLDDNFASIVSAIRLGRRIFDNIQKAWGYVLAMHIPIIGLSLLPVFFHSIPLILMPVHIIFMELIIDPVSSIVFENEQESKHIMTRRPRSSQHKFFSKKRITASVTNGLSMLFAVLAIYAFAIMTDLNDDQTRTLTFSTLILSNLLLALSSLSSASIFTTIRNPGVFAKTIMGAALLTLLFILFIPFLSTIFHLQPVSPLFYIAIVFAAILSVCWPEAIKLKQRHISH